MSPKLPARAVIREVGPRDGFQNEPEVISTADKIRLINQLGQTGLDRIEVASFVRPDVIRSCPTPSKCWAVSTSPSTCR